MRHSLTSSVSREVSSLLFPKNSARVIPRASHILSSVGIVGALFLIKRLDKVD